MRFTSLSVSFPCVALLAGLLAGCGATPRGGQANTPADATAPSSTATKPYPLDTCLVTGNALGSMGDEQSLIYRGQTIKFCCAPCVDAFHKNPEKYLAKLPTP